MNTTCLNSTRFYLSLLAATVLLTSCSNALLSNNLSGDVPLSGSDTPVNPVTSVSGPAKITAVDKTEVESGDVLKLSGQNLKQPNLTLLFSLPNQGTFTGSIISATDHEMTTYAPWVPADKSSLTATVVLKQGDVVTSATLNVTVRPQKMNNTQQQMVSQLQQSFVKATDAKTTANTVDALMNQMVSESSSAEEALKKMDYAFASSLQGPEDVEKFILALDELTQKYSFATQTKIEIGPPITFSNDVYYASFDPDNETLPENRIPEACKTTKITDEIQPSDDLVVLYINGINTRSDQFCQTKLEIADLVTEARVAAKVSGMYQHSLREDQTKVKDQCNAVQKEKNKFLLNKWQAFLQRVPPRMLKNATRADLLAIFVSTTAKMMQTLSCDVPLLSVNPVATDIVHEILGQRGKNDRPAQVYELANMVETLLKQNKRVVLMPHSQGNFFARQALELLLEKASARPMTSPLTAPGSTLLDISSGPLSTPLTKEQIVNSVGVIWLANPVELQFPHTVRSKDLVCNDTTLEPTCHSYSVSLKEDLVAHLRFMSNTDLMGSGIMSLRPTWARLPVKVDITALKINKDYISAYNKAMLNAPIIDKKPDLPKIDGGEAGIVSLGFTAHDVNCSYLLDPVNKSKNKSEFCEKRLNNGEIELVSPNTSELPRVRITGYLQALEKNLKRPNVSSGGTDTDNTTIITPTPVVTPTPTVTPVTSSSIQTGNVMVSTLASGLYPDGIAVDSSGNVYVADGPSYGIIKITPAGVVRALTDRGTAVLTDGSGPALEFAYPSGVAVDGSGNVYAADTVSYSIFKITPTGRFRILAGRGTSGFANGSGGEAQFYSPEGVAVDGSGNVYVSDTNGIRKITPAGIVSTLAGSREQGFADGGSDRFDVVKFYYPNGIAVDASGNIYVADSFNHRIRKISSSGVVWTLAGSGIPGFTDGNATRAQFNTPRGVAVDESGNVYVADNHRIRKITPAGMYWHDEKMKPNRSAVWDEKISSPVRIWSAGLAGIPPQTRSQREPRMAKLASSFRSEVHG